MATNISTIRINVSAEKVWEALTNPTLVKQWQFGSDLITTWETGTKIRFETLWEGTLYEQWGTVLVFNLYKIIQYNLFAPRPDLEDRPENYFTMTYSLTQEADVVKLDILVADEIVPAFSRIVSRKRINEEAEAAVEKLHKILPRQMFVTKIQAKALGRIISSRTVSAFSKDVTQHMYGGDITRKMKLREKQKKGKKKMKARGKVNIPQDVFLKMMRS